MRNKVTGAEPEKLPTPPRVGTGAGAGAPPRGARMASALAGRLGVLRGGGLFIGIVIVMLGFTLLNPAFISFSNLLGILRYMSSVALMGLGFMVVLVVAEIDISFGYTYGLVSTLLAVSWIVWGWPVYLAIMLALLAACLIGLFNAFFTTVLNIPSFIVTLGSGALIYGFSLFAGNSASFNPSYPPKGVTINPTQLAVFNGLSNLKLPLGIPTQVLWMLGFAGLFYYLMHASLFGFRLSAIGGNPQAALLARLPVRRYKFLAFLICALMAAVASILDFSFISSTQPDAGQSFLFPVIAGVIIGGASLSGGRGTVIGTLGGSLLLSILSIGLALIAAGPFAQQVFLGTVTIAAVALDQYTHRKT